MIAVPGRLRASMLAWSPPRTAHATTAARLRLPAGCHHRAGPPPFPQLARACQGHEAARLRPASVRPATPLSRTHPCTSRADYDRVRRPRSVRLRQTCDVGRHRRRAGVAVAVSRSSGPPGGRWRRGHSYRAIGGAGARQPIDRRSVHARGCCYNRVRDGSPWR